MIIVEGPDGGGKTTLIKQLADYFDLPVAPRVVSKDAEAMTDLKVWTEENLEQGFQPVIYDRHRMISELIYGPILRGEAEAPFNDLIWLNVMMGKFYDLDPLIIYCLPPLGTVLSNTVNDPDNKIVAGKIWTIYNLYVSRAALDWTMRPNRVVIYDYTRDGQESNPIACFKTQIPFILRREGFK